MEREPALELELMSVSAFLLIAVLVLKLVPVPAPVLARQDWEPRKMLEGDCQIALALAKRMGDLGHHYRAEPQQQEEDQ